MSGTEARLDLASRRNEARTLTIRVVGADWTGLAWRQQVRLAPDTPGGPTLNIAQVQNSNAEGLYVQPLAIEGGLPVTTVKLRYNMTTMRDQLPYAGERGSDLRLTHSIQVGGQTRLSGDWWAVASPMDSDNAPAQLAPGYGSPLRAPAITGSVGLTVVEEQIVSVTIADTALVGAIADRATQAAADAADAAGRALAAAIDAERLIGAPAIDLLAGEDGFAIDGASDVVSRAAAVVGGGKDHDGDLRSWLPASVFAQPKIITGRTGQPGWTAHNAVYGSDDLTGPNWYPDQATVAAVGLVGIAGVRVTADRSDASFSTATISLSSVDAPAGTRQTDAVLAAASTAPCVLLTRGNGGPGVLFDLAMQRVVSADAGLSGTIQTVEADGSPLPRGWFLLAVTGARAEHRLYMVPCDAAKVTAVGASVVVARPRGHLGDVALPYVARARYDTNVAPAMPVAVPYDWSRGERRVLIEPADLFSLRAAMLPGIASLYIEGDFVPAGENKAPGLLVYGNADKLLVISRDRVNYPQPIVAQTLYRTGQQPIETVMGAVAQIGQDDRLAFALRLDGSDIVTAISGDLAVSLHESAPVLDALTIGGAGAAIGHRLYLRTMIGLSRALSDVELARWSDAAPRLNNAVVASAAILRHKATFAADHATRAREPVVRLLGEVADTAYLLCTSHQKWGETDEAQHPEAPTRLLYRTFVVQRGSGRVTALDEPRVFYQPPRWSEGRGHSQSVCGVKLTQGPRRGQMLMVWGTLEPADRFLTGASDIARTILGRYIGDNGRGPLAPPFVVKRTADLPGAQYLVMDPSGQMVEFPAGGPFAGRVAVVLYTADGGRTRCLYSDDQGASWTFSAEMPQAVSPAPNENNLVLLPSGTLLCLNRVTVDSFPTEPDNIRTANISIDGGATWSAPYAMPGYRGGQVSGGLVQVDPVGSSGIFGRVALSRSMTQEDVGRNGTLVSHYIDPDLAPRDEFMAQPRYRGCGYSSLVSLFGGELYALAVEISAKLGDFNGGNGSSTFLKIINPRRALERNPA